jgi:peroxiredoxin 5
MFPDVYCRGYLAAEDKLKAAGVEEVLVYCVNDGAVMDGWAKDQGVAGSIVTFLADTRAELTKALGMEMTHPGPMSDLGNLRCKRHAALVVDGVITAFNVSEAEGDPGEWQQQHTHTHR